jgi:hypothetical protein
MKKMRGMLPGMSALLLSVAALGVALGALHQERKTRHHMERHLKEARAVLKDCRWKLVYSSQAQNETKALRRRVDAVTKALPETATTETP